MAHGIRPYAKNGMVGTITQEFLDGLLEAYVEDPRVRFSPHSAGGVIQRVDEMATAFPHRHAEMMLAVIAAWTDPDEDEEVIGKLKNWYGHLEPFTGGYYDNIEFDRSAATGNYGPAHNRLARIKGVYDPGNLFRLNSNIRPAP